jgi:hypothetical protein
LGDARSPRPAGGQIATQTAESRTGAPRTLARYDADVGERELVGQRVDGVVRITDVPASRMGRSYLVEDEIGSLAELETLVTDYLAKAKRLGYVPMHGWF